MPIRKYKIEKLERNVKKIDHEIKVDKDLKKYKKAQKHQIDNGGPGPVADYETMAIVNEYDGKFEITAIEELDPIEEIPVNPEVIP